MAAGEYPKAQAGTPDLSHAECTTWCPVNVLACRMALHFTGCHTKSGRGVYGTSLQSWHRWPVSSSSRYFDSMPSAAVSHPVFLKSGFRLTHHHRREEGLFTVMVLSCLKVDPCMNLVHCRGCGSSSGPNPFDVVPIDGLWAEAPPFSPKFTF